MTSIAEHTYIYEFCAVKEFATSLMAFLLIYSSLSSSVTFCNFLVDVQADFSS